MKVEDTVPSPRDDQRRDVMKAPDDVSAMLRLKTLGWGSKRIAAELGCSRTPASTSRSVCVAGDGMAMGRIIPHTPGVWRARVAGAGWPCSLGLKAKGFEPATGQDGGTGIPTFRLRNQAKTLKCHPKKLVE
jgi:hypothetical protein